jgi:hypothetical protein
MDERTFWIVGAAVIGIFSFVFLIFIIVVARKGFARVYQQMDTQNRVLQVADEHQRRYAALLDRWETQAQRIDSLLDNWERKSRT